jgi:cation diffusion facilitator family transporter
MDSCCRIESIDAHQLEAARKRVLQAVLAINAALFIVEVIAGLVAHSTALLADSLDMLGDALVYGLSLYVLARRPAWGAQAAFAKGAVMAVFGIAVLGEAIYKVMLGATPHAPTMGAVGTLALLGNAVCALLLFRHRADDLNMRSTWLCSRNDLIGNVSVLGAAAGVAVLDSLWPDVIVGGAVALLYLRTSLTVLRESAAESRLVFFPAERWGSHGSGKG